MLGWYRLRHHSAGIRRRFMTDTIEAIEQLHQRIDEIEEQLRDQQAARRELELRASLRPAAARVSRMDGQELTKQYTVFDAVSGHGEPQPETTADAGPPQLLDSLMPILTPIRSRRARLPDEARSAGNERNHVCFFATTDGYDLLERPGVTPTVGSVLDLGEGRYGEVVKVARSPLPGDGRRCAYLLPVLAPAEEAEPSPVRLNGVDRAEAQVPEPKSIVTMVTVSPS